MISTNIFTVKCLLHVICWKNEKTETWMWAHTVLITSIFFGGLSLSLLHMKFHLFRKKITQTFIPLIFCQQVYTLNCSFNHRFLSVSYSLCWLFFASDPLFNSILIFHFFLLFFVSPTLILCSCCSVIVVVIIFSNSLFWNTNLLKFSIFKRIGWNDT